MTTQRANNSLLCPSCRRLVSRDAQNCPYCGTARPGSWLKNNPIFIAFSDDNKIIPLITYVSVGMYILSLIVSQRSTGLALNPFDFLSPSNHSLLVLGSTGTVPILKLHRWWTLVSANYLHGSLIHLLFNMIALRQIAPLVIREFGGQRMFAIYTLGGVGGFYVSFLAGIPFTIGASAAVCSLIGAMLYYGKSRGGIYGQQIYRQIGGWAISIMIFGLLIPGINNWGHGGGMAAGVILGALLGYRERNRLTLRDKFLSVSCYVLTAAILAWAIVNGLVALLAG
ncbi:MAG: rhomboid family intramembrane serine protease [Proteobacteria bacterium]|nr:rhomboid family intramembrane serine protease [Desulfobulbaceae bacterium]MBU4152149.1 rhomboid family intramembrane serine protease [Pseudomonadota bacterium]